MRRRWVVHCVCVGRVQPVGRRSRASLSPPSTFSLSVALILPHILTLLPPIICALVLVTSPTLLLFCALCLTLVLHYTASPPEPEGGAGCLAGDVVGLHLVRQPAPASCASPGKHQHPALTKHQQLQPGLKPKTLPKAQRILVDQSDVWIPKCMEGSPIQEIFLDCTIFLVASLIQPIC